MAFSQQKRLQQRKEGRKGEGETQRDTEEMQHRDATELLVNSPHFSPL